MNILAATKLGTTPKGQAELVALAVEQAELNTEEEPIIIEDEHVERYILCATQALPYFSVRFLQIHLFQITSYVITLPLLTNKKYIVKCTFCEWSDIL